MSEAIKKIKAVNILWNQLNSGKKNNQNNSISTIDGTVFEEFDDGSWQWTEKYNGRETTFHEYPDGTKTLDYIGKHGRRIIDTVDKDGNLLNRRYFGETAERYTIYENGESKESELFKIYDIDKQIDASTKKNVNDSEWVADGKFRKHDAEYHRYPNGSTTIDYIADNGRYIYTYDKDGILKDKKVITDNNEVLSEYDDLGNIVNVVENKTNYSGKNEKSENIKDEKNIEEIKNTEELVDETTINNFKSIVEVGAKAIDSIIQENKKNLEEIHEGIQEASKEEFYKYPSYQEKLKRAINDYNQCDGIISDVDFFHNGDLFSKIGCGVASIMYIYAMLNDDFDFDPNDFVSDAKNQGYFTSFGSNSYMLLDENLASSDDNVLKNKWGLEATQIDCNAESIISALEEGKKVIFNVAPNDGFYATGAGHYIVLDHYDKETNQIYVFDPAARPGGRPTERMGYQDVDMLIEEMFNIPNNPPLAIESNKVGKQTVESEEQQVIMQEE